MNYSNYDMQVIQKFQVKLVGWTYNKFLSPFEINTIDDVRTLVQALRCGRCHWVRMTVTEVTKHANDVEARKAAGETVGKPRKIRSDLGSKKPRKRTDRDDDEGSNNEPMAGPSKKRKVAVRKPTTTKSTASKTGKGKSKARKSQLPPASSKEFISESDEASDSA